MSPIVLEMGYAFGFSFDFPAGGTLSLRTPTHDPILPCQSHRSQTGRSITCLLSGWTFLSCRCHRRYQSLLYRGWLTLSTRLYALCCSLSLLGHSGASALWVSFRIPRHRLHRFKISGESSGGCCGPRLMRFTTTLPDGESDFLPHI